jgi:hypothetical protein
MASISQIMDLPKKSSRKEIRETDRKKTIKCSKNLVQLICSIRFGQELCLDKVLVIVKWIPFNGKYG